MKKYLLLLKSTGLFVSLYLVYHHYLLRFDPNQKSFCSLSNKINCDLVGLHPSSEVLAIPVAVYGVAFYLTLIWFQRQNKKLTDSYTQALIWIGFTVSCYFFVVSKWIIGSICLMCSVTYVVNLLLAIHSLFPGTGLTLKQSLAMVYTDLQVK